MKRAAAFVLLAALTATLAACGTRGGRADTTAATWQVLQIETASVLQTAGIPAASTTLTAAAAASARSTAATRSLPSTQAASTRKTAAPQTAATRKTATTRMLTTARAKTALAEQLAELFLANEKLWTEDASTSYLGARIYAFLDLDFDSVPELIFNEYAGSGKFTYARYYKADLKQNRIVELQQEETMYDDTPDFLASGHTALYREQRTGSYVYLTADVVGLGAEGYAIADGTLAVRNGVVTAEYFRTCHTKGETELYYLSDRDAPVSQAEYDAVMTSFLASHTDVHLQWEGFDQRSYVQASQSQRRQMLLDSCRAFSYDGYTSLD